MLQRIENRLTGFSAEDVRLAADIKAEEDALERQAEEYHGPSKEEKPDPGDFFTFL